MRNYIKLSLALLVFISLMSFSNSSISEVKSKSNITIADTLTWKMLGDIKYVRKKHATYGEVEFPQVNMKLKMMQKKTVFMSGFIVPIDNKNYALSKNVFAACFFCGKSGPETIAGIKFKGGAFPKLKTDTYVTLKGTFRYNETDVEDWIYHIENAEIISQSK
ncbi:MAG: hypothetical protein RSE15_10605 [Flavobacterium sp.]|jgi:hypothetical protein|uniref:hypothetical protein n=1 Tax=Flavobacterium sp. TaxID=239 RepID=UPI001B425D05|nr:hypothetical protein [Flavobacterium sp.]MBP9849533.1 hypothetical protein [Flavobacterium sp.]TAF09764.1 MAG: hypothetical protein EAZ75_07525 [Flavobacteriia bacterium]WRH72799.1 MAG: hypothetical protein RSE15_10605 [Flavobacterium sp.]